MVICPKDVVDIYVPRRDDGDRLMGPPIIKLEFKKDILDSQRMKKERPILCERCLQFLAPQKVRKKIEALQRLNRTSAE